MLPPIVAAALVLVFPALVIVGAVKDALSYTIPNWISLALVAAFPAAALAVGLPPAAMAAHLAAGAGVLAVGMLLFARGWLGGGDAKLLSAAVLWMGWPAALIFLLKVALAGGLLALTLKTVRSGAMRPLMLLGPKWVVRLSEPGRNVPYGVAIAAGALWALSDGPFASALGL
jgi:prepilin peptidase CpaA